MIKKSKCIISVILINVLFVCQFLYSAVAFNSNDVTNVVDKIVKNYSSKSDISQWEALGLILNKQGVDESYFQTLKQEVSEKQGEYRLVTDYARIIILLRAKGVSIYDFAGYNLAEKLLNSKNMTLQGVNGPIFSLIATYGLNVQGTLWNQESLLNEILKYQNSDGGFSLSQNQESTIDITAMAVYALSDFKQREEINTAIEKAVSYLSNSLADDGNYYYLGEDSSESLCQVIIALCKLGIDINDSRFVKNNKTLIDTLLGYRISDSSFSHTINGDADDISTQQALLALTAYNYYISNKGGIYDFSSSDAFADMDNVSSWAKEYIIRAKKLNLISGDQNQNINPQKKLSRAEFVTLLTRILSIKLPTEYKAEFTDVDKISWYWAAVEGAYDRKIINGRGNKIFAPDDSLSNQDFAVIITNAYNLVSNKDIEISDMDSVSNYAKIAVKSLLGSGAWHYSQEGVFSPHDTITREQAIVSLVMIYDSGAKPKEVE